MTARALSVEPMEPSVPAVAIARDPTGRWVPIEPAGWIAIGGLEVIGDVEGLPVIRIEF